MARNKVKFNICNVHYAKQIAAEDGTVSYDTPIPMPGAVSLSLDPNGEPSVFYADGCAYYTISNNQGYEGDFELAMVPDSFRRDILNESLDSKKVLVENAEAGGSRFALLFEFDGDVKHIRHVLYNCSASRPGIEGKTNEESREVQTETLSIKATPLSSGVVKAKTGNTTSEMTYQNWYRSVYMPADISGADVTLSAFSIGSCSLKPAFDPAESVYEVITENAADVVTAVAADPAADVLIVADGASVTNGTSVTWDEMESFVTVTVNNQGSSKTYRITVVRA